MGMLICKLPLIIIVAPKSSIVNRQLGVQYSKYVVIVPNAARTLRTCTHVYTYAHIRTYARVYTHAYAYEHTQCECGITPIPTGYATHRMRNGHFVV